MECHNRTVSFPHVVLTGFMGSGKTTAGRLLAAQLGVAFIDLDDVIEAQTGLAIPALFARYGETTFRTAEHHALLTVLSEVACVVALGGGAIETEANRLALRTAHVIYLSAPFDILHARCLADAADPARTPRPNFADPAAARLRFHRREPLYRALATLTIDVAGGDAQRVAREIAERLRLPDGATDSGLKKSLPDL